MKGNPSKYADESQRKDHVPSVYDHRNTDGEDTSISPLPGSVSAVASERLENLKETGGIPPAPLSNDAQQIKNRQDYEKIPEGDVRRGGKGGY